MNYLTINDIKNELTISKRMISQFTNLENLHGRGTALGDYYYVLRNRQEKYHDKIKSELLMKEIKREWKRLKL